MIGVLSPTRAVLADSFEGQPLVRPNDLVIDKKDGIYFTDPIPRVEQAFRVLFPPVYLRRVSALRGRRKRRSTLSVAAPCIRLRCLRKASGAEPSRRSRSHRRLYLFSSEALSGEEPSNKSPPIIEFD